MLRGDGQPSVSLTQTCRLCHASLCAIPLLQQRQQTQFIFYKVFLWKFAPVLNDEMSRFGILHAKIC